MLIDAIIRLIRDDPDGWVISWLVDGTDIEIRWHSRTQTCIKEDLLGHMWLNSRPVSWWSKRRIRKAIESRWAKSIEDHLTGRSHPEVALLSAPRD